jgi:hypothetical protein
MGGLIVTLKESKYMKKMNSNDKCQYLKQIITKPRNFESTKQVKFFGRRLTRSPG